MNIKPKYILYSAAPRKSTSDIKPPIFSGDGSRPMWEAIRQAETTEELSAALYLVCCRMQELESKLIELFETAPRIGADDDVPEGVRYIQISDTLARKLLAELRSTVPETSQRAGTAGDDK